MRYALAPCVDERAEMTTALIALAVVVAILVSVAWLGKLFEIANPPAKHQDKTKFFMACDR